MILPHGVRVPGLVCHCQHFLSGRQMLHHLSHPLPSLLLFAPCPHPLPSAPVPSLSLGSSLNDASTRHSCCCDGSSSCKLSAVWMSKLGNDDKFMSRHPLTQDT